MAGGAQEHNAIAGQLAGLLHSRRKGACRYYTPDQRYWIGSRILTAVSAGENHTCGIDTAGTIRCWGRNNYGQATPP